MINRIIDLLFPPLCQACDGVLLDKEEMICTTCRHHLPVIYTAFTSQELNHEFLNQIRIKSIAALFYFQKGGLVQKLLHHLKYKNQQKIGVVLGQWFGHIIKTNHLFTEVEVVIPVPIHYKRLRQRGYNQVLAFALELAVVLDVPCEASILKKIKHTKTQVFQSKTDRWISVAHSFELYKPEVVKDKRVLLVDDLITTGATIKACTQTLELGSPKSVSVASIAIASYGFR